MAKKVTPKFRKFFVYLKTSKMFDVNGNPVHVNNFSRSIVDEGGKRVETISYLEVFTAKTIKQAYADMQEYCNYLDKKADAINAVERYQLTSLTIVDKTFD